MEQIFSQLESFLNEKFPVELKQILELSGFDTKSSLMSIKLETIADIENYANENPDILKNTTYENTIKFKFKPGHKSRILLLPNQIENSEGTQVKDNLVSKTNNFSQILKTFIETAESNFGRPPNGYRYDEMNRNFSTFVYLLCGRACYDTLSANLPIPSSHAILRYINENKSTIIEGELRCKELREYLKTLKCPMCVWLSEDASAIVSKIEFDQRTNQMIGIVLPFEQTTGMPIPFSFLARNAEEIQSNMKRKMSTSVYLVMAQPLANNTPPFLLQLFGTDNTFKTKHVLLRWQHTVDELKRYGIDVAGFSADGDARLLKSMQHEKYKPSLQDILHIATKLRNRVLNLLICLLIGNKAATVSHLKILLNLVPKDVHGLVYSDICPDDRQNFNSLTKIMDPRVRKALAESVMDSEATIEYIRICSDITTSLYKDGLQPTERLFLSWRATYFLRAWRIFVTKTKGLTLENNFLTTNAYGCIELNSQNLVILIKKFRNENMDEFFLPNIFNSQPCEQTFRTMRSMGTVNYTKINFTLLELIHMVGRIELMNEIMYFKLLGKDICFPRDPVKNMSVNTFKLPNDEEIENMLQKAASVAIVDASKFGINVTADEIADCNLQNVDIDWNTDDDVMNFLFHRNLRDYPQHAQDDENSSFTNIAGRCGTKTVRKTSLIWNLSSSKERISSDRLNRVRGANKKSRRQLEFVDVTAIDKPLNKAEKIKIGDWCIFKHVFDEAANSFILGNVISFQYASSSKKYKDRKYTWDFASTLEDENDWRKIEVLSYWYKIDVNGIIHSFDSPKCSFISIDFYVATLLYNAVDRNNSKLCISRKYLRSIQNLLKECVE